MAVDALEHGHDLRFIAHIGLDGEGFAPGLFDLAHHLICRGPVGAVVHHHAPALLGGQNGRGSTNTAAGAGHK